MKPRHMSLKSAVLAAEAIVMGMRRECGQVQNKPEKQAIIYSLRGAALYALDNLYYDCLSDAAMRELGKGTSLPRDVWMAIVWPDGT